MLTNAFEHIRNRLQPTHEEEDSSQGGVDKVLSRTHINIITLTLVVGECGGSGGGGGGGTDDMSACKPTSGLLECIAEPDDGDRTDTMEDSSKTPQRAA